MVGDSLRITETPSTSPVECHKRYVAYQGTMTRDAAKRVSQLLKSMDHYPLLLSHVGTDDATSQKIGRIKENYKVLVRKVTNTSAQVISHLSAWSQKQPWSQEQPEAATLHRSTSDLLAAIKVLAFVTTGCA